MARKEPAMMKTATGSGMNSKDAIHHIVITPTKPETKGGPTGFSVEHHYNQSGPETHAFSPGRHAKMVKHLKKHLGIAPTNEDSEGEEE